MNSSPDPNDEKAMRIAYLIAGFLKQTITPQEHDELDEWVEASDENMLLFEELTDEETIEAGLQKMKAADSGPAYEKLQSRLPFVKEKKKRSLWPYAVAASFILATAGIYFFKPFARQPGEVVVAAKGKEDIQPGSDKAVLTLADGKKIILENQRSGDLHGDGTVKVIKLDSGQIAYQGGGDHSSTTIYNTLTTPKGGQYSVTLSDGTRVWLNAASSLRFPVIFNGSDREVELSGEAYLEVAPDKTKPFYVRSKGQEIKVLGTRFNVNAYSEDDAITTTLLEGSIQLSTVSRKTVLKAGEEALVDIAGTISVHEATDMEAVLAWKEGWFRFRNATIEEMMKQVGRWYDAQIVYEGKVNNHFNGEIARRLPVSKVLALFEKTGSVHFQINDKIITVKP